MGNLAIDAHRRGYLVSGSDAEIYPPMSTELEKAGIKVFSGYSKHQLSADLDAVIIGNVVSRGNEEVEAILENRLPFFSLPEWIKLEFLSEKRNAVVAGTHGKTSTSSMLAWLLSKQKFNPSRFIGGVPLDFDGGISFVDSDYVVLEGDEYDSAFFDKRPKFLHYLPEVLGINAIEFDHADIYSCLEDILYQFELLIRLLPQSGKLVINGDDFNCLKVAENALCPVETVGFSDSCSHHIEILKTEGHQVSFLFDEERHQLNLLGKFNVHNACVALRMAKHFGFSSESLNFSLFRGVKRRQEIQSFSRNIKLIDDFAHHPSSISAMMSTLKNSFSQYRLRVVFEPASYTSQSSFFQKDFISAFAGADEVIFAPIGKQRKFKEGEYLDIDFLIQEISQQGIVCSCYKSVNDLASYLFSSSQENEIIAILSNSNCGNLKNILVKLLR